MQSSPTVRLGRAASLALAAALLGLACSRGPQEQAGTLRREASRVLPLTASGQWSGTGALATARDRHTATLLPSGQVLITGGYSEETYRNSSEMYDPATGQWSPTQTSMNAARVWHTATLLPSGKVLVAGGVGTGLSLHSSAEEYDPVTQTWSPTAGLSGGRAAHKATVLRSGKILVSGGFGPNALPLSTAEEYDPRTQQWSPIDSPDEHPGRAMHTATLLQSGEVLVAGGAIDIIHLTPIAFAAIYAPDTRKWSSTPPLMTARSRHTATLLPSGKILVAGGAGQDTALDSAEVYDPATGQWSPTGSLHTARYNHTATLLPSGKVLVTGGRSPAAFSASAEVYDPGTGKWSMVASLADARDQHTATLLPSGKVLVTGGSTPNAPFYLRSTELFDPAADVWAQTGALPGGRDRHTSTLLASGQVLVAGGFNSDHTPVTHAAVYDPAEEQWRPTDSLGTARAVHTATRLISGQVLVTGGFDKDGHPLQSTEAYASDSERWEPKGPLTTARARHTATLLDSGKVLVIGGVGSNGVPLGSAEVYDPDSRQWTPARAECTARYWHTATRLLSGKVLITGGFGADDKAIARAEVYDPGSESCSSTATGDLPTARANHTATLLHSGKVLITGGQAPDNSLILSSELYDPDTKAWSATGPLATGRIVHTAELLPSGRVLVIGGYSQDGASTEVYDPATGQWLPSRALSQIRAVHTSTQLSSSWVLVIGGIGVGGTYLTSTEVYNEDERQDIPRPVLENLSPQKLKPELELIVRGTDLRNAQGVPGVVRLLTSPEGELKDLTSTASSSTSVQVTLRDIPEGLYLLFVLVDGVAGGQMLLVDGTPPEAPTVNTPGRFTQDSTPYISGLAEPGSQVWVSLGDVGGPIQANTDGTWSFTPAPLQDDTYRVFATAMDAAGNVSAPSEDHSFTIDTKSPEIPEVISPGGFTPLRRPVILGKAEPGSKITVLLDGLQEIPVTASTDGRWEFIPSRELTEGKHKLQAMARDDANNISDFSKLRSFEVGTPQSHYGWSCSSSLSFPVTWALLVLTGALGRRRLRAP